MGARVGRVRRLITVTAGCVVASDAVSLVNTFLAMAIDIETRRPKLTNVMGGLSGPAIRPIAVRTAQKSSSDTVVLALGRPETATVFPSLWSERRARRP